MIVNIQDEEVIEEIGGRHDVFDEPDLPILNTEILGFMSGQGA